MKRIYLSLALLALAGIPAAASTILYDNTTTDTLNTVFYSVGPYTGIGDQIQLTAAGPASTALVQLFNLGGAGAFDVLLSFYQVGAPVGAQIGGTFTQTGISAGSDIIDLTFALGGLALPQDVIFVVSLANVTTGMELGVNLFEPPTAGTSDNTFLIVNGGGFSQATTNSENVYFQLTSETTAVPEPSTMGLAGAWLATAGILRKLRHNRAERRGARAL